MSEPTARAKNLLAFVYLVMGLYLFLFSLARKDRSIAFLALFLLSAEMSGIFFSNDRIQGDAILLLGFLECTGSPLPLWGSFFLISSGIRRRYAMGRRALDPSR